MDESSNDNELGTPPPNAVRSPCPALNALSNHGHLPQSGRNISFLQLLNSIRAAYNISFALALVLTIVGFFFCGHNGRPTIPFFGTIDLHDLARHNRIEHDASLAHADAPRGAVFAPTTPDIALLKDLLAAAESDGRDTLSLTDFARVRSRRERELAKHGKSLSSFHAEITRGEIALILSVIGNGKEVSVQHLKAWMGKDALPEGWRKPHKTRGLLETVMMARVVEAAVRKEKERDQKDRSL